MTDARILLSTKVRLMALKKNETFMQFFFNPSFKINGITYSHIHSNEIIFVYPYPIPVVVT